MMNRLICAVIFIVFAFSVFDLVRTAEETSATWINKGHLPQSSVILGLIEVSNKTYVSEACDFQLKEIRHEILRKKLWAMKVLDGSATKSSNFIFGHNFWLGNREACDALRRPLEILLSDSPLKYFHDDLISEMAPFDMDYRVVYLRHYSSWQLPNTMGAEKILHIGLCLPSVCSLQDVEKLTTQYVKSGTFVNNDIYDAKPEVMYVKDLKFNRTLYEWRTFKVFCVLMIFTATMMLLAFHLPNKSGSTKNVSSPTDTKESNVEDAMTYSRFPQFTDFIRCFDIQKNFKRMFSTRENLPNEIPVINGIRTLSCVAVIGYHTVFYSLFAVNSSVYLSFWFYQMAPISLAVENFFAISGFLQTYIFFRNTGELETIRRNSLAKNLKQFLWNVFHRYLRIGPLYIAVLVVITLLNGYISDASVFHIYDRSHETCPKYFWRNLFLVQNLFEMKQKHDLCMSWTWSLACEMQYYVLARILLIAYTKKPQFVKTTVILGLIANVVWTFAICVSVNILLTLDSAFYTYVNSFVRVLPYIIGAVAAWYLMEKKTQLDMSPTKKKWFWSMAICVVLTTYTKAQHISSSILFTAWFVLGRLLYSAAISWIFIGSAAGRGTWWSRVLELKIFQHTNRLTYAIYLLNPVVIKFIYSANNRGFHVEPLILLVMACGFVVITYLTSIIFSLAFEMPYCNLSSLLKRFKNKGD